MKEPTIEQKLIACIDARSHDDAFVHRVMQSLPSNPEILSHHIRTTNDQPKKGSFMSKLKLLPIPTIGLLIALSIMLLGGTAYAAYTYLWKPAYIQVEKGSTDDNGHSQNKVAIANCSSIPEEQMTIETKRNVSLTPDEIKVRLQAQCEYNAVVAYMSKLPTIDYTYKGGYIVDSCVAIMPSHLGSTIQTPACKTPVSEQTYDITQDTKYIKNGVEVDASSLSVGSALYIVAYITDEIDPITTEYISKSSRAVAVVELSLPPQAYASIDEDLAYRSTCLNNLGETCLSHVAGDQLYMRTDLPPHSTARQYSGRVTSISGDTVKIKTTSGRIVTIVMPVGTLAEYKQTSLDKFDVNVGDLLQVVAITPESKGNFTISANEISYVELVLETNFNSDSTIKY